MKPRPQSIRGFAEIVERVTNCDIFVGYDEFHNLGGIHLEEGEEAKVSMTITLKARPLDQAAWNK